MEQSGESWWLEERERVQLLTSVFEHSSDALIVSDAQGRVIALNHAFTECTGYGIADMAGQNPRIMGADPKRTAEIDQELARLKKGESWQGETRLRKKDGTVFPCWLTLSRIHDERGALLYIVGSFLDISIRKHAVAELALLGRAFENSISANMIVDDELNIVRVNQAFLHAGGYTEADLVGKKARFDIHPSFPPERVAEMGAALRETGRWQGEQIGQRKDGSSYPRWTSVARIYDGEGRFTHSISSSIDITDLKRIENELRTSEERLRLFGALFDNAREAFIISDVDRKVVAVNPAFTRVLGYTAAEVVGRPLLNISGEHDSAARVAERFDALEQHGYWEGASIGRRKDGSLFPRWLVMSAIRNAEGAVTHRAVTMSDISAIREAEGQLRLFANIFDHAGEALVVSDADRTIVLVNAAFTRLTGYTAEEVRGRHTNILSPPGTFQGGPESPADPAIDPDDWIGEAPCLHQDGTVFPRWMVLSTVRDEEGTVTHRVAAFTDISERKLAEREIERLAHHDALTGLPNRLNLTARLEQAITGARRAKEHIAVLLLDLDRFKTINDTLGHAVGDLLLIEVGRRLTDSVRESDIVARLGGDEFVVVLTNLDDGAKAVPLVEKMLHNLAQAYVIENHQLHSTPSIGISAYPEDGLTMADLLKNADAAMYHAKAEGRNTFRFFTPSMNHAAEERLVLENNMRVALTRDEFFLHYQPQINLLTGETVGFEALLRWQHPEQGLIPPGRFIPIAEESGMIIELGAFALREALRQLRAWRDAGHRHGRMAVNLSAHEVRDTGLPARVVSLLEEFGLEPEDLELEITESAAMKDPQVTISILKELRAAGIELAVDDFGTGYSSLSYLKLLPIQRLKLDASFVRNIETDPSDAAICTATLALAHSLGLEVVAEGVETEVQLGFMRRQRCDIVQGYYFSRPLPAHEAVKYLEKVGEVVERG